MGYKTGDKPCGSFDNSFESGRHSKRIPSSGGFCQAGRNSRAIMLRTDSKLAELGLERGALQAEAGGGPVGSAKLAIALVENAQNAFPFFFP